MAQYDASELMTLSHQATDRFKELALTGIKDRESLLAAVQLGMPKGIKLVDASANGEEFLLAQETQ